MFKSSEYFYYLTYAAGFFITLLINLKTCGSYSLTKKKTVIYTVCMFLCGIVGAFLMADIYNAYCLKIGETANSTVSVFGAVIFAPVFMTVFLLIEKNGVLRNLDMLTPGVYITLTCAKFGCFLDGCCMGIPYKNGIYNPIVNMRVFPVQICEAASMIIMLVLTQIYIKKGKNVPAGFNYPLTTAVYCVIRFMWEYMRYYDEVMRHGFFGVTFWQGMCVVMFVFSAVMMTALKIRAKKSTDKRSINE